MPGRSGKMPVPPGKSPMIGWHRLPACDCFFGEVGVDRMTRGEIPPPKIGGGKVGVDRGPQDSPACLSMGELSQEKENLSGIESVASVPSL